MATTTGEQQHYWLLGIKTAWKAKILWEQWNSRTAADSNTTFKNGARTINKL
jgi:hypothetical protein